MDNNFYTYAYLRENRTPYYIGKGRGRRVKKDHNVAIPPPDRILYLKRNLSEEEAFRHEVYMIAVLGRKDLGTGILRNLTNGGDGASGRQVSHEQRKKTSEALMGHPVSDETRKLLSENSWSRGEIPQSYRDKQREISLRNGNVPPPKDGTKWWTNGEDTKMQNDCPGEGWIRGRGEMHSQDFKKEAKERCLKNGIPASFNKTGTKWWTNGEKTVMASECPGTEWRRGRK